MRHAGGKPFIVMNADLGGKGKADFYLFCRLASETLLLQHKKTAKRQI